MMMGHWVSHFLFCGLLTDPRGDYSLVVVGVDTHAVLLQIEGVVTELAVLQFVLVKVRPTPDTSVDHVRESLPSSHLSKTP